ncbi:hypothetical protein VNO77_25193 [Canavalia gladiata]|uniref:Uncharacterized protein n=1 Tax=Canavalia gladiata TaxID=3824 RepID=A0AAN9L914_CANGL
MLCGWLGGECEIGFGDCTKSREEGRVRGRWESREMKQKRLEIKWCGGGKEGFSFCSCLFPFRTAVKDLRGTTRWQKLSLSVVKCHYEQNSYWVWSSRSIVGRGLTN